MVVTRQDRVVIYQMEEREVEHTWSVEAESIFADQITFFDCSFLSGMWILQAKVSVQQWPLWEGITDFFIVVSETTQSLQINH